MLVDALEAETLVVGNVFWRLCLEHAELVSAGAHGFECGLHCATTEALALRGGVDP